MGYLGEQTNFSKEIQAFASQVQEIENALWSIYDNRNVRYTPVPSNTARNMLDDFGGNVGLPRLGLTDMLYSLALKAKIQANKSCGEPERLIAFLRALTGSSDIHYTEFYPCLIYMTYAGLTVPANALAYMQAATAGGVRTCVVMLDPTTPFRFDTAGQGFDQGKLGTEITNAASPGFLYTDTPDGAKVLIDTPDSSDTLEDSNV